MLPTSPAPRPEDPFSDFDSYLNREAEPPAQPAAPSVQASPEPQATADPFSDFDSYLSRESQKPFLPPPIPGVAEGVEAKLQFGNGTRSQPTVMEQLGGVGRAVVTGGQQLLGGLGTALETAGQGMQQPGITGGALAGVPLQAIGEVLSKGGEAYARNTYDIERERQAMAQQSPGWGFAQDVAAQIPQIAAAAATGGGAPALALLGASAAGQGIQQAEAEGATPAEAVAYGATSGLIEAGTERIGTIPLVDKILKRAIVGPVVKPGAIKRVLKDIAANFGEEAAATVGNELAALATYQQEVSPDLLQKTVYSGLVGAGLGGLVSGGTEVANRIGTEAPQQAPPPQMPPPVVEAPPVQEAAPVVAEPVQVPIVEPLPPQPEVVPQAPPAAVAQPEPQPVVQTVTEAPPPPQKAPRKRKAGPSPAELDQLQAEAAPVEQAPAQPTAPTAAPPVQTVVPQEAQNGEVTQADVAEAGRPAPDQIPVAPEAGRPAPAAVLEETPDALRKQEGNQEGRQEVAPTPPVPATVPEAVPNQDVDSHRLTRAQFVERYRAQERVAAGKAAADLKAGTYPRTEKGQYGDVRLTEQQARQRAEDNAASLAKPKPDWWYEEDVPAMHKRQIQAALDEGQSVPPEVLAEYPDLKLPEAVAPAEKGSGIVAGAAAAKPGEQGMATTASAAPFFQIPVNTAPPAAAAKPLGTQGVVSSLSKLWDVPVRFNHFRKRAQAIFKTRPEVVRMREAGDLPAAAHEIAHYIDKTRPTLVKGAHKAAKMDLVKLGMRLYPKGKHTVDFYESEGFAEYMRHRLTRDDAAQEAPEFDTYFNGAVVGDAELVKKLDESKALYDRWRGQAPIERAKGQIDFDQELGKLPAKERAVEVGRKAVSAMVDSWAPLDTFTQEMIDRVPGMKREDLPPGSDPYRIMAAFQGSEASIARQMMLHGVRDAEGTIIAAPVKEAMSKVKADDWRDFFAYALAKRTIELEAKGKDTGLDLADAQEIVKAHETPEWADAAKGLNTYANGLVDILQGAGALTQAQADKIKESEWYIPLTRVYEAESGGRLTSAYPGKQKQSAGGGEQPIQKLKGSTRPIQDPMLSLAQLTERVVNASTRAKVFRAVYGLQSAVEGAGDIIEEVDPPRVPTSFTLEKIRKQLEDMGIDVPADADGDALLTIFSNSAFPTGSDPIVTGVVNGERKFLYVKDPLLYQSLAHMPPPWLEATKMLWPIRKLASAVRMGATGLNPGFGLITNFIRDAWTGTLQTVTNPGSFVIRMARSAGKDTEADKLFYAGGGEMSTPIAVDLKPFRKLKREIAAQTTMDEVLLRARHPVDSLRDLIAFTETFGRRAEFRRVYDETLKKTGNKEDAWVAAQEAASEVTVNFRRAGIYGRALNQIIPFFNVAIQGPRAGAKAVQRNPGKAFLTAAASLTVPALALYALHRDEEWYQEIPVWEKAIFLHFKVGNQVIRLPLPFEWGIVFATFPIAALDRLRDKDKARFEESYGVMLDSLLPDKLPAGVRQAYEWSANVNLLTGRDIESERLKALLPEDRYYSSTSEVYKKVGKMLGLSPVKLQNTAEGLTGGLSRNITDPFKAARAKEAADIPVVGRLFSRQLRTGQSVSDIYNESEKAEQVYASILKALDEKNQKDIDRLEAKYDYLLGVNPEGALKKGATRERYPRLYLLRDAKKLLKEAKGLDDPKMATKVARIMLGRDRLEDLPEEERKALKKAFTFPQGVK